MLTTQCRHWDTPLFELSFADLRLISRCKQHQDRREILERYKREFPCPLPEYIGKIPNHLRSSPLPCNSQNLPARNGQSPGCRSSNHRSKIRDALRKNGNSICRKSYEIRDNINVLTILTNLFGILIPRDFWSRISCHLTRESHRVGYLDSSVSKSHCEFRWSVFCFVSQGSVYRYEILYYSSVR